MEALCFVLIWIGGASLHTMIELSAGKSSAIERTSRENRKEKRVR